MCDAVQRRPGASIPIAQNGIYDVAIELQIIPSNVNLHRPSSDEHLGVDASVAIFDRFCTSTYGLLLLSVDLDYRVVSIFNRSHVQQVAIRVKNYEDRMEIGRVVRTMFGMPFDIG